MRLIRFLHVAVALWGCALVSGCSRENAAQSGARVFIACDTSGSVSPDERRTYLGLFCLLIDALHGTSHVVVCHFGREAQTLYEGQPRDSDDALPVIQHVQDMPAEAEAGTYPAAALEWAEGRSARGDEQRPFIVIILTDGEDLDVVRTRAAAGKLAALSTTRLVIMAPVLPAHSARLEASLSPLGDRAMVASDLSIEAALDWAVGVALHQ